MSRALIVGAGAGLSASFARLLAQEGYEVALAACDAAKLGPAGVRRTLEVTALGAFLMAQQATCAMLPAGGGTILLTGASAGLKGYAQSAPFAMGKFALRGLAQSMARELHPQGVHVVHVVVDGDVRSAAHPDPADAPDSTFDPDAIVDTMLALLRQPRSVWTDEIAVRPWVERF